MRVLLPLAIFLVLAGPLPGAESATDLTTRLLRMLGTEEVAALKQKPPDSSRTAALGRAAELLRPYADAEHAADHFKKWDAGVFPQLQGMLGEFPKLAKLAEQWNESRRADYFAWEKTVLAEMHKAARDAVVKACKAEKPGDLDEPITSLATILGKYFYNRGATTWPAWESGARDITDLLSFVNLLRNLLAAEEEGRRREALGMLRTLFHEKSAPCFAPAELHALLNRHARKLGMPSTDEAEDAVRGIIAKAMAAAKPAELDPPLDQINRAGEMWSDLRSSDETIRTLFRLTEVGREFVVRWQDFLIQRASGEIKSAQATLRNLAAKAETEPLYPRAQLLEIAAALNVNPATPGTAAGAGTSTAELELAKIKTLDDLTTKLPDFAAAAAKSPGEYQTVVSDLERIQNAYVAMKSGDLSGARLATFGGFNKHPKVPELRAELALRLAAIAFHGEGEFAPRDGELLNAYIRRLATDAQQRKDWHRLKEILETASQFPAFNEMVNRGDGMALRLFLAGRNLDAAGVWESAVDSYIQALKTGSTVVPAEEITQRVEAIRQAHPEDYQRGVEQAGQPPQKSQP